MKRLEEERVIRKRAFILKTSGEQTPPSMLNLMLFLPLFLDLKSSASSSS